MAAAPTHPTAALESLLFIGGEPLLFNEIEEIIGQIKNLGLKRGRMRNCSEDTQPVSGKA